MMVHAMRVTEKVSHFEYDEWAREHCPEKVPDARSSDPRRHVGDAIYDWREDPPRVRPGSVHDVSNRERDLSGGYALLSEHFFYYFGDHPVAIPEELQGMVQRRQGRRSDSNAPYLDPFVAWLEELDLPVDSLQGVPGAWANGAPAPVRLVSLGSRPRRRPWSGEGALSVAAAAASCTPGMTWGDVFEIGSTRRRVPSGACRPLARPRRLRSGSRTVYPVYDPLAGCPALPPHSPAPRGSAPLVLWWDTACESQDVARLSRSTHSSAATANGWLMPPPYDGARKR